MSNRLLRRKRSYWIVSQVLKHKYSLGAEIGVHKGNNAYTIMGHCPNLHLILVDKWENIEPDPNGEKIGCENDDMEQMKRLLDQRMKPYRKRITVLRGDSAEMADEVENGTLDFVFIDADHRYQSVKKDIAAWTPKLKPGGLLSV